MSRGKPREEVELGTDSFLDVIANMVGIVILLVMIAGLRMQTQSTKQTEKNTEIMGQLEQMAKQERSLESEVMEIELKKAQIARTALARKLERDMLGQVLVEGKYQLEEIRRSLDQRSREEFDLKNSLALAEEALHRVEFDLGNAKLDSKHEEVQIDNYPTPISHVVHGDEFHFQVRNHRILFIPMDEMIEQLKLEMRQAVGRLREQPQITETFGPIGGFRIRYTLARVDVPVSIDTARSGEHVTGGSYARIFEFSLLPESDVLGETLEEALRPGSEFQRVAARLDPKRTTVTLWTYPESFVEYRTIKKELYARGLAVAGRPMPEDQFIGGSPQGTKSVAQ